LLSKSVLLTYALLKWNPLFSLPFQRNAFVTIIRF
jgi:hypothetical protein